jgi:hypothetical protein
MRFQVGQVVRTARRRHTAMSGFNWKRRTTVTTRADAPDLVNAATFILNARYRFLRDNDHGTQPSESRWFLTTPRRSRASSLPRRRHDHIERQHQGRVCRRQTLKSPASRRERKQPCSQRSRWDFLTFSRATRQKKPRRRIPRFCRPTRPPARTRFSRARQAPLARWMPPRATMPRCKRNMARRPRLGSMRSA